MIVSMTGYGAAQMEQGGVGYALEIRSVNNRYLKLNIKLPDDLQFAETEIDRLIRSRIFRGTVTCTFRRRSDAAEVAKSLNVAALQQYVDLLAGIRIGDGVSTTIDLATVAQFPGVADPGNADESVKKHKLDILLKLTQRGIEALTAMRRDEGKALSAELHAHCDTIRRELEAVAERAPFVVNEYHDRLKTRVATLLQGGGFELAADGLMREVAIYAERCDITEEISRLRSHLDQFVQLCDRGEQVGRTLDFLAQELLREANTIGSKSNDTTIARAVVQIKSMIDRLKEQVQNVE
jgi:uncharacterized protein (TIGR00255 family)